VLDISNYRPYLKYKSRRAVVEGKFLEPGMIWKDLMNRLVDMSMRENIPNAELTDACVRARNLTLL